jgi:hypothetical protein
LPTKILRLASLDTFNSPDKMKIEKMLKNEFNNPNEKKLIFYSMRVSKVTVVLNRITQQSNKKQIIAPPPLAGSIKSNARSGYPKLL